MRRNSNNAFRPSRVTRFGTRLSLFVVSLTLALPGVAAESAGHGDSQSPGSTGTIRGSVTVGPELMSRRVRFSLYPDVSLAHPHSSPALADEIRNVVIYLEGPAGSGAPAGRLPALRMEQRDESFVPHVLPVPRGSTVEFPNSDPIFHNVFSLSRAAAFDLGRYPRGNSRSVRFDEPGVIRVFCHIHSDMSAVILVLENPLFSIPDSSGEYEISGIPPGSYSVIAWHERSRPIRRVVTFQPDQETQVDFSIPLQDAPFEQ